MLQFLFFLKEVQFLFLVNHIIATSYSYFTFFDKLIIAISLKIILMFFLYNKIIIMLLIYYNHLP